MFCFQRATLAEKEILSLKEELLNKTDGSAKTETHHQISENSEASTEVSDANINHLWQSSNLEKKLEDKDKEVSSVNGKYFKLCV